MALYRMSSHCKYARPSVGLFFTSIENNACINSFDALCCFILTNRKPDMTRINVVPVESLTREHLIAEYRELPRIFALAHKASQSPKPWNHKQSKVYTLGTGHMLFFYDKLLFLAKRHKALTDEMLKRGYKPSFTGDLRDEWQDKIPAGYWKDYLPTPEAIAINQERIDKRLAGDKS